MASASVLVIDRGLPTSNLNNVAGASRSNVAWEDGSPDTFYGDSFTMPISGKIDTIRTWVVYGSADNDADTGDDTDALGDVFDSLTLYLGTSVGSLTAASTGNFTGGNSTDNAHISISRVQYNGGAGSELDYQGGSGAYYSILQIDFTDLGIIANAGDTFWFGVDGAGAGDPYWFNHASNAALSGSPQDGADNVMRCFTYSGGPVTDCGAYDSNGNGWDKSSDINVQVFAHPVPEPASLALFGMGLAALGFKRRRRSA